MGVSQSARILYETRGIPGPPSYPLIGSLPTFLRAWNDLHGQLILLQRTYGNTLRMWVLNRAVVIIMDPDDVQVRSRLMRSVSCRLTP